MRSSLAALLAVVALHGRAPAQDRQTLPLPDEDQQRIAKVLGPGVVGRALPSDPIRDASVYFPLVERTHVFHVTSGPNAGKRQTLRVAKGQRPNGNPAWRFEMSPSLFGFLIHIDSSSGKVLASSS